MDIRSSPINVALCQYVRKRFIMKKREKRLACERGVKCLCLSSDVWCDECRENCHRPYLHTLPQTLMQKTTNRWHLPANHYLPGYTMHSHITITTHLLIKCPPSALIGPFPATGRCRRRHCLKMTSRSDVVLVPGNYAVDPGVMRWRGGPALWHCPQHAHLQSAECQLSWSLKTENCSQPQCEWVSSCCLAPFWANCGACHRSQFWPTSDTPRVS